MLKHVPQDREAWQKLNTSGKLLFITLVLNFSGQLVSLPSIIYRSLFNYNFDIPLDAYVVICFNTLNSILALTSDMTLVFTSIYRVQTMKLLFELGQLSRGILLALKIIIPFMVCGAIIATSWVKFGWWRVWIPAVTVGFCQALDQILLIVMWYSTIKILLGKNKNQLVSATTRTDRQLHFHELMKTLTQCCAIFAFLFICIAILYLVGATIAIGIYFEIECLIICLGSIHIVVSLELLTLLKKGVNNEGSFKSSSKLKKKSNQRSSHVPGSSIISATSQDKNAYHNSQIPSKLTARRADDIELATHSNNNKLQTRTSSFFSPSTFDKDDDDVMQDLKSNKL